MPSPRNLKPHSGKVNPQDLSTRDPRPFPSRSGSAQEQLPPPSRMEQIQSTTGPARTSQQQSEAAGFATRSLQAKTSGSQSKADSPRSTTPGSRSAEGKAKPSKGQQTGEAELPATESRQTRTLPPRTEQRLADLHWKTSKIHQEMAATTKSLTKLSDRMAEADRDIAEADRKVEETERRVAESQLQFNELTRVTTLQEKRLALEGLHQRWTKKMKIIEGHAQLIKREIKGQPLGGSYSARDQRIFHLVAEILIEASAEHACRVEEFI